MRGTPLIRLFFLTFMIVTFAVACAPAPAATPAPPPATEPTQPAAALSGNAALNIIGAVGKPLALSISDLKGMQVIKLTAQHPKLGNQNYEGVRLNAILEQAQVKAEATKLTLNALDGFTGEVVLAELRKCADCLIAINGTKLDAAMPGMASNLWVRDIVKIEVK